MAETFVIGDVHGERAKLVRVLWEAGLIDGDEAWAGGERVLRFLGDYVDRGPDGIGVIELIMRLQGEAADAGGRVRALLGNHEVLLLAVRRFGRRRADGRRDMITAIWERNGGQASDLARLTTAHADWLAALPALALDAGTLFLHADATFYAEYGGSVDEANQALAAVLRDGGLEAYDRLLEVFTNRRAFDGSEPGGAARAAHFLGRFGARRLVHGHTPIFSVRGVLPGRVRAAHVYLNGLCVNVDGGMCYGGPGFAYRLPPLPGGWR